MKNMKTIKIYLKTINPHFLDHLSGNTKRFVTLLQEKNFSSEEIFAKELCGDKSTMKKYSVIKTRALKILQALAIVSNTKSGSTTKKKFDQCQKKFFIAQKLITQGERVEGLRLAKQAYQLATDYDFIHLACELASIIHHNYIYYHPNKRVAKIYAEKTEKHINDYFAEKKAEQCYFALIEKMNSTVSLSELEETIKNIHKYKGGSIKYTVYLATVYLYRDLYLGNYAGIIENCNNILQFFQNKKGVYPVHYLLFLRNRGTAQTALGRYKAAMSSFEKAEHFIKGSPYNNYLIQFYKTLNAFHAKEYQLAYDLYQKNKRCKIEPIRQQFAIVEAYLCFLIHAGYLHISKTFRIGKYLNETFKTQQDKKGDNVNIIIAELLVYLARDWGKFIDRIEAIKNYSYRHLKGEDTKRAKYFLKILCLIAHSKVNFHPVALQRKAGKYIEILTSHPVRMGENFAIEIIPFDHLLNMIIERVMRRVA